MSRRLTQLVLIIVVLFCTLNTSQAQNVFSGSGYWSNAALWSLGHVPVTGEDCIISGSCTVYVSSTLTVGNVTIEAGDSLTINGSRTLNLSGELVNNGVVLNNGSIKSSNTGLSPVSSGQTWFGIVEFSAASGQRIPLGTYNNLILSASGSTKTMDGDIVVQSHLTVNAGVELVLNGKTVNLKKDLYNSGLISDSGLVRLSGTLVQNIKGKVSFLELDNIANASLNDSLTITSKLSLTQGNILLGTKNLYINNGAEIDGSFGTSNMVVINNTGYLIFRIPASYSSPIFFPIGETANPNGAQFTPVIFTFSSNSSAGSIGAKVIESKHPDDVVGSDFLSRYWTFSTTALGNYSYSIKMKYDGTSTNDVSGTEANIRAKHYCNYLWAMNSGSSIDVAADTLYTSVIDGALIPLTETSFTGNSAEGSYFRTVQNGVWNNSANWEFSPDNNTWGAATSFPTNANSNGVLIQSGDTITVNAASSGAQINIQAGAKLLITNSSTFTLANRNGIDLTVSGLLVMGDACQFVGGSTSAYISGEIKTADAQGIAGASSSFPSTTLSFEGNSTIEYNGVIQFVTPLTYDNLVIGGTNTKTLNGNINVHKDLVINSSLNGSLRTIFLSGNWINNGTFTAATSTVNFNGNTQQLISGSTTSFYNVTNSNTTDTLKLLSGINTFGTLTINTNACISPNTNQLIAYGNVGCHGGITGTLSLEGSLVQSFSVIGFTHFLIINKPSNTVIFDAGPNNVLFDAAIVSGTVDCNARTLNIGGNFTNQGNFMGGTGFLVFNRSGNANFKPGISSYNAITINKQNVSDSVFLMDDNLTAKGTITLTQGTLIQNSDTIFCSRDWSTTTNGRYNGSGKSLVLCGSSNQTMNNGDTTTNAFGNIVIRSTGGTVAFGANPVKIIKDIMILSGLVSSAKDMYIYGNWYKSSGATLSLTNTVVFKGAGNTTIENNGNSSFYNLTIMKPSLVDTVFHISTDTLRISGNFLLQSGTFMGLSSVILFNNNIESKPGTSLHIGTQDIYMRGHWKVCGYFNHPGGTVHFYRPGIYNIGGADCDCSFNNLTIHWTQGLGSYLYIRSYSKMNIAGNLLVSAPSGALYTYHKNVSIGGDLILDGGTLAALEYTTVGTGYDTISIGGDFINNGYFEPGGSNLVMFNGNKTQHYYTGTGTGKSVYDLGINSDSTVILEGNLTVSNNVYIEKGTFDIGNDDDTIYVSNSWYNRATFNPRNGLVQFGGGITFVDPGSSPFYNLKIVKGGLGIRTLQLLNNKLVILNNITNGSGTLDANDQDIEVSGDWDFTFGDFWCHDKTVTFNGNSIIKTGGTNASTKAFNNVVLMGDAMLSSNHCNIDGNFSIMSGTWNTNGFNMTVEGHWENASNFIHGNALVTFDGNESSNVDNGLSSFYNLTIAKTNSADTVILQNDLLIKGNALLTLGSLYGNQKNITISGNWTNDALFFPQNNTVTFDSISLIQTRGIANGKSFYNVGLNGISATLSNHLKADGNFDIATGTWDVNASNYQMYIGGNWTNDGTFNKRSGTVEFFGDSSSIISGNTETAFYNFNLNKNIDSNAIFLYKNSIIDHNLTFTKGIINSYYDSCLIINSSASVTAAGYQTFVNGVVRKIGNQVFEFPLGDVRDGKIIWAPLAISAPVSSTDNFAAWYEYLPAPNNTPGYMGSNLDHVSYVEHWNIERLAGSATPSVTLHWKDAPRSGINSLSDLTTAHFETASSIWENMGGTAMGSTGAGGIGYITTTVDFTDYSPITFGSTNAGNWLPIELISFEAQCYNTETIVYWSTASEINNDYFTLERSTDIENWEFVERIDGAGNSNVVQYYQFTDNKSTGDILYYRLTQTDFDGKCEVFSPISVVCSMEESDDVKVYPNPFNSELNFELLNAMNDKAGIKIYDMIGKLVFSQQENTFSDGRIQLDLQNLPAGVYNVEFTSGDIIHHHRVVKK